MQHLEVNRSVVQVSVIDMTEEMDSGTFLLYVIHLTLLCTFHTGQVFVTERLTPNSCSLLLSRGRKNKHVALFLNSVPGTRNF